jgi:hypothetical protein
MEFKIVLAREPGCRSSDLAPEIGTIYGIIMIIIEPGGLTPPPGGREWTTEELQYYSIATRIIIMMVIKHCMYRNACRNLSSCNPAIPVAGYGRSQFFPLFETIIGLLRGRSNPGRKEPYFRSWDPSM